MTRLHDCAHEDAPGMKRLAIISLPFATVTVEIHLCRECEHAWWLVDGVYFDPAEWDSLYEVIEHAQVLRR